MKLGINQRTCLTHVYSRGLKRVPSRCKKPTNVFTVGSMKTAQLGSTWSWLDLISLSPWKAVLFSSQATSPCSPTWLHPRSIVLKHASTVLSSDHAPKPVPWNKITRLLSAWGILLFVLVTSTRSNSRRLFFFLFFLSTMFIFCFEFQLWVELTFKIKKMGSAAEGESLEPTWIRHSGWREEISCIPFHYFSVTVGGLCGRNPTLFCLPISWLNGWVAELMKTGLRSVPASVTTFLLKMGE